MYDDDDEGVTFVMKPSVTTMSSGDIDQEVNDDSFQITLGRLLTVLICLGSSLFLIISYA